MGAGLSKRRTHSKPKIFVPPPFCAAALKPPGSKNKKGMVPVSRHTDYVSATKPKPHCIHGRELAGQQEGEGSNAPSHPFGPLFIFHTPAPGVAYCSRFLGGR